MQMKIFLDYLDKRTKFLETKLTNYKTYEITNENLKQASKGDFIVFPPNKKWKKEEIISLPNEIVLFCGKVDNSLLPTMEKKKIKYINFLDNELFAIDFSGGAEDRNIKDDDYPLSIRRPLPNDEYQIKDYKSKVKRLFIDWKMPNRIRAIWPAVYNKDGRLIYIPRYSKEFEDKHKSVFKIKLEELFN